MRPRILHQNSSFKTHETSQKHKIRKNGLDFKLAKTWEELFKVIIAATSCKFECLASTSTTSLSSPSSQQAHVNTSISLLITPHSQILSSATHVIPSMPPCTSGATSNSSCSMANISAPVVTNSSFQSLARFSTLSALSSSLGTAKHIAIATSVSISPSFSSSLSSFGSSLPSSQTSAFSFSETRVLDIESVSITVSTNSHSESRNYIVLSSLNRKSRNNIFHFNSIVNNDCIYN